MKTSFLIPPLTAALLLAAALSPTHAASLIKDGNFDSLPVGTAPDSGKPAGSWFWDFGPETSVSQFSIAPAPGGGTGNALRINLRDWPEENHTSHDVGTELTQRLTAASGKILQLSFDIYVEPGVAGPYVMLADRGLTGAPEGRTSQIGWEGGSLLTRNSSETTTLVSSYPKAVWQSVRLELDLARRRFNFYWSEKGQPVSVTRSNLGFRGSPAAVTSHLWVGRFNNMLSAVRASVDNIRVTTDPVITPVTADLPAGGATTLQVVNLPAGDATSQWQRNGQDIAGATAATLELSNATADQAGSYTVVVTRAGQSVTTEASTIRVFDKLTITTPPEKIEALSGKTTGFSVAAVGPLSMTYQWRFNGADLPGKTNRFLTFPAKTDAAGDYSVVVSDANGSVVSDPAKLSVLVTPTFVQAPLAMKVVAGSSVTFSAAVAGPGPFTYQWRKGSSFDSSTVRSTVKSPETNAFFTLSNVQASHGGTYRLYLGNPTLPDISSLSPSRSFTLTVLPDTDGDGLPDEWETANGLSPTDAADAVLDRNSNGVPNLTEYRTGSTSGLRVETVTPSGGQAKVSFTAAANLTYTVEASSEGSGGTWEKVGDVVAAAAARLETVTDPRGGEASRFYRVVTPRRP